MLRQRQSVSFAKHTEEEARKEQTRCFFYGASRRTKEDCRCHSCHLLSVIRFVAVFAVMSTRKLNQLTIKLACFGHIFCPGLLDELKHFGKKKKKKVKRGEDKQWWSTQNVTSIMLHMRNAKWTPSGARCIMPAGRPFQVMDFTLT